MTINNWTLFIQERLRAYDPEIDLDAGSQATVQIVDPVISRLSPDPIETDLQLFILTRLQQEYPQLYANEGSALADLLVKPLLVMLEPLRREIRSVKNQLSIQDPKTLSADEADALMANLFVTRARGEYATVRVRIYFQNPLSVNISSVNVAFTSTGLRFVPTQSQSITAESMIFNTDGNLYYFDVSYTAERPGSAYNIPASSIVGVTGIAAATRATNISAAHIGQDEQTTSELIAFAESSIGERSTTTIPGIVRSLFEEFPTLRTLQVIGFNDQEMQRDIIVGGDLGDILHYGTDGSTADDGDADGWTPYFDVVSSIDFTTEFGPPGTDLSGYSLTAWYNTGSGTAPHEFDLKQVESATQVSISDDYDGPTALPDSIIGTALWAIRSKGDLTLSNIPGGILFPDSGGETLSIPNDTIHVGGCTDIYVRGGEIENETIQLLLIADSASIARREDARTLTGSPVVILQDLTAAEAADVIDGKTSLHLEQGSDEGAHRIIEIYSPGPPFTVKLDSDMTATANGISYNLIDDIDINLINPREMKYEGSDLRTVAGTLIVDTVSGSPNFPLVDVEDTDYLRILNGSQPGEYSIASVSATQITLDATMSFTESPLQYEIYRKDTGASLPLHRVTSVERLDSSLNPTGEIIPYKHPIGSVSRSFQNPGRGAKAGTDITITLGSYFKSVAGSSTIEAVDSVGSPMSSINYYALGVRADDIVNITSTDNQGFYTINEVGGDPSGGLSAEGWKLDLTQNLRWSSTTMIYEIGPRSYGSFRLYFLEPCSFEMTYADSNIAVEIADGVSINFKPDPDIYDQYLPTPDTIPTFAVPSGSSDVTPYDPDGTATIDVMRHSIQLHDRVEITYAPIIGSQDISGGGYNLDNKTIIVDVGSGPETVTFSGTSLNASEIISQIDTQLSRSVVSLWGTPPKFIRLQGDFSITLKDNSAAGSLDCTATIFGTNRTTYQPWLAGLFAGQDTPNDSPFRSDGYLRVVAVGPYPTGDITLEKEDGTGWTASYTVASTRGHYAHISGPGRQRISSTDMDAQIDELGFYYFDVECVSEGYGDLYNIDPDLYGAVSGHESEGWEITTEDDDLSFSMAEIPWINVSPRILVVGSSDDPDNKVELPGTNVQISYDRDLIVEQVHDYMRDPQTRVVCNSPLVRSLLPVFVRTAITYRGTELEADLRATLADHIESILPDDSLEISDLMTKITESDANYIALPIVLMGIYHNNDRTITFERSENTLFISRLVAMFADDEQTVDGASHIYLTRII